MNTKHIVIAALSLLTGAAAMAQPATTNVWAKFQGTEQYASASRSRAEVIADLQVYRKSGLADLAWRDAPDVFSAEYQAAQARYQAMRASPEFSALVSMIARERGESLAAASGSAGTVAQ